MYKVLIADDESLVISSLKNRINWNACGFEIIGEARSGTVAYESILRLRPDIVFTDIRMPGMTGLELIRRLNGLSLNIQFVVISGYAEFEYAQKALNYGALGFCLKPFDEEEISEILKKAKSVLDGIKESYKNEFIELLEDDSTKGHNMREEILRKLGFISEGKVRIQAAVSIGAPVLKFSKAVEHMQFKIGTNKNAYLFKYDPEAYASKYYIGNMSQDIKGLGLSKIHSSIDELDKAIDEACISAGQFFITGKRGVYEYTVCCTGRFDMMMKDLRNALLAKSTMHIESALDSLEAIFKKESCTIKHAMKVYNMFLYLFDVNTANKYENLLETQEQLIDLFPGVDEMLAYLRGILKQQVALSPSGEVGNDTYKKILSYINSNYCSDISVQSLASKFSVNPNYISQLFRREKGETFTEYLTKLRMEKARNMLKTTGMPVYEVADGVGYRDYFHFAKVFKRMTGKTPKAYRENG